MHQDTREPRARRIHLALTDLITEIDHLREELTEVLGDICLELTSLSKTQEEQTRHLARLCDILQRLDSRS